MSVDRQTKVAEEVAHHVAEYIRREANTDPLITVTRAEVNRDYSQATIFITTIPDTKQEAALVFLKRAGSDMRHYVKTHMRIKQIPFLSFEVDYGERHRQHIDEIVRETGVEPTFEVLK